MSTHLINGEFQSDKYPTTPRGKVPLSVKDTMAQDLLWQYAQRRRDVDPEFSDDLEAALRIAGYQPPPYDDHFICESCGKPIKHGDKYMTTLDSCYICEKCTPSYQECADYWREHPPRPDDEEEMAAAEACEAALARHLAIGGSPDDKPLTIMEW
jgi:hypothetical protein